MATLYSKRGARHMLPRVQIVPVEPHGRGARLTAAPFNVEGREWSVVGGCNTHPKPSTHGATP